MAKVLIGKNSTYTWKKRQLFGNQEVIPGLGSSRYAGPHDKVDWCLLVSLPEAVLTAIQVTKNQLSQNYLQVFCAVVEYLYADQQIKPNLAHKSSFPNFYCIIPST